MKAKLLVLQHKETGEYMSFTLGEPTMRLTTCNLSSLLDDAKEAHTRYEERFRLEGQEPPQHRWQDWYARFIMQKLRDQEYNELFQPVNITCAMEPEPIKEPRDPIVWNPIDITET